MTTWRHKWFGAFRRSFPDIQMELLELVAYFFALDGDRIASVWGTEDTLDRFQQLGLQASR